MTARSTARCYFSAAHVAYQEFPTPTRSVEQARLGPEGVPEGIQHAPLVARADAMHFVVRSDAEEIRTLSPKSYERVVVALPAR
jgi:hypothetical protein